MFFFFNRLGAGKKLSIALGVAVSVNGIIAPKMLFADAQNVLKGDVKVTVNPMNIKDDALHIPGINQRVTLAFHSVSISDVLRAISKQAGFNVLIDESVTGSVSVDWQDVLLKDALTTLKSYGNLSYAEQGNTLLVAEANSPKAQSFQKSSTQIIPLKNANATVIASFLNSTVFADRVNNQQGGGAGQGGGAASAAGGNAGMLGNMPVTADFHTNSLVVVGSPKDIQAVKKHLEVLDKPRQMKTWRLSQANVLDVANLLSASLFNEGQPPITLAGSGGGAGSGSAAGSSVMLGNMPSLLRVNSEEISEGNGLSNSSQSSGGEGEQGTLINSVTLRTRVQKTETVQVSPNGPVLLPDTRLNMLTLLGTAEQIAMAEALIPTFDRKVPQVVLEASLIELSEEVRNELGFTSAGTAGFFSSGSNNSNSPSLVNRAFSNPVGRINSSSTPLENIFRFNTNPISQRRQFVYQLNALASKNKVKVLANPTVVTTSDNETLISIVDEIIVSTTVVQGAVGAPAFTNNIGEAGIILNILPKVGANNTVSLRVRPIVSTIAGTEQDRLGNQITLLSKREALSQNVQLQDGETFFLGGLIQDTNTKTVSSNPLLSKLPILGALARNSVNNKRRSELVIMITPHIVQDSGLENAGTGSRPYQSSLSPAGLKDQFSQDQSTQSPVNPLPQLEPVKPVDSNTMQGNAEEKTLVKPAKLPFSKRHTGFDSNRIPLKNSEASESISTPKYNMMMLTPQQEQQAELVTYPLIPVSEQNRIEPEDDLSSDSAVRSILNKL